MRGSASRYCGDSHGGSRASAGALVSGERNTVKLGTFYHASLIVEVVLDWPPQFQSSCCNVPGTLVVLRRDKLHVSHPRLILLLRSMTRESKNVPDTSSAARELQVVMEFSDHLVP
jgi:hypothetical protein